MLTDKILKGINKAWGASEEDDEPDIGDGFADWLLEEATRFGINPFPHLKTGDSLSQAERRQLHTRVREAWLQESQAAEERYPAARREWKEQWQVPESEREGWGNYPWDISPTPYGAGGQAWWNPGEEGVSGRTGYTAKGVRPDIIAHEHAHANWFENMPPAMQRLYPYAQQLGERLNPEYREAVASYWTRGENEPPPYTRPAHESQRVVEGYPTAYQQLGKQPEQMPWYKEPFYGNLMYPVPEGQDTTFRWLLNWAMDKYRKWQQEKQGTWSPPMPEEEVKRLLHSGGVKDMDWNTLAAEQKKKGGGWSGGGAKPELL